MVIEYLTLQIPEGRAQEFLTHDAEIWTQTLAAQPGFMGKETWIEREDRTRVHLIIRWASHAEWKAVPTDLLAETDARMTRAFGCPVPVLSCGDLEVIG